MNIYSMSGNFSLTEFTSGLDFWVRDGATKSVSLSLTIHNFYATQVTIDSVKVRRLYASKKDDASAATQSDLIMSGSTLLPTSSGNIIAGRGSKEYSGTLTLGISSSAPANVVTGKGTSAVSSGGGLHIVIQYRNGSSMRVRSDSIILGQDLTDTYLPIWVKPFRPRLSVNAVRCTGLGAPSDEGDHVLIAVKLEANAARLKMEAKNYPSAPAVYLGTSRDGAASGTSNTYGLTLTNCYSGIYEFVINSSTGEATNNLASGASPKISDTISASSDYYLKIAFNDSYEPCSAIIAIPRAFANVHLSEYSGGGVCFGGYSKSASEAKALFETYYPTRFYQGVEQFGSKFANGSLWSLLPDSQLLNGATTSDVTYGDTLKIRKIENKCIIKGCVMIKPGSGSVAIVELPDESYKPIKTTFRLAACQGARIARIAVHGDDGSLPGNLVLEWVRNLSDGDLYTSAKIWVDCSIEYWID